MGQVSQRSLLDDTLTLCSSMNPYMNLQKIQEVVRNKSRLKKVAAEKRLKSQQQPRKRFDNEMYKRVKAEVEEGMGSSPERN